MKYPVTFSVDYPDRTLDRVTSFFRIILAIPILIVLSAVSAVATSHHGLHSFEVMGGGGVLVAGPLLMILFRQKYPRWWFDWNLELLRFSSRVSVYLALMNDQYPSTDEAQSVHLNVEYPNVQKNLNRGLPLIKWFLAIPHYIVLILLSIAAVVMVIVAWLNILLTGRYPRSIFDFVEGVMRWHLRVIGYAFLLATDEYPPFSLSA